jgi:hypothetical protein
MDIYHKKELLLCLFCFVLFFELGSLCVAQAGFKLVILLTQPPKCWNYRHAHYTQLLFLFSKQADWVTCISHTVVSVRNDEAEIASRLSGYF